MSVLRTGWPRQAVELGTLGLLLLAILGEGGSRPAALLGWHALLVGLLLLFWWRGGEAWLTALARLPFGLFLPLLLVVAVGAFRASYGYAAWIGLLELAAFLAVAVLGAAAGPGFAARLQLPLLCAAAFEASISVRQWWAGAERVSGTFLNPNDLAGWLAVVLLLTASRLLDPAATRSSRRAIEWALAGLALVALALTGSRGALLGLLGGGVWLAWRSWSVMAPRWRRVSLGLASVALVVVGAGVASRLRQEDPFRYQRLRIWNGAAQAALQSPLLGVGPRQFPAAAANFQFPDGHGPLRYDRVFATTHSDLLRAAVELGGLGLAALLLAVAAAAREIGRRRRQGQLDASGLGAAAGLIALALQALVDNPSRCPALYLLAAALLGALLAAPRSANASVPRPWRLLAASFVLLVLLVGDVAPYLAWRAAASLPSPPLDARQVEALEAARRRNPLQPEYWMRHAEQLAETGLDPRRYAEAREAAERAVRLHPADGHYRRRLARLEATAYRTLFRDPATRERARSHYIAAGTLRRYDPFIPVELAAFLLDAGDPAGARRAAERALELEPEAVLPRLMLAEALLDQGGTEAPARAGRLLAEAEAKAARWSDWLHRSSYARDLLGLDRARFASLHGRVKAGLRAGSEGGTTPAGG